MKIKTVGEAYLKDTKGNRMVSLWLLSRDLDPNHKEILDQLEAEYYGYDKW